MRFLAGLTSTKKDRIPGFLAELREAVGAGTLRDIALFPTCLDLNERRALYTELETVPGLRIPHVHLRSDMDDEEIAWISGRFGVELWNVHPARSRHAWRAAPCLFDDRIFIENADVVPGAADLDGYAGLCVDFAHWESGRLMEDRGYDGFRELAGAKRIGCCHISAVRPGQRSVWGGFDHHVFMDPAELDYILGYREFLPATWASLELENGLEEQLRAIVRLEKLLAAG